jgi:hypothetical protein
MARVKPRHAHGSQLESYFVYRVPVHAVEVALEGARLEVYRNDDGTVRAAHLNGDVDPARALTVLRAMLERGEVRWLELGLRAYALMEGKREYRPWRRNAHLSLAALGALERLEPEVHYHAPV